MGPVGQRKSWWIAAVAVAVCGVGRGEAQTVPSPQSLAPQAGPGASGQGAAGAAGGAAGAPGTGAPGSGGAMTGQPGAAAGTEGGASGPNAPPSAANMNAPTAPNADLAAASPFSGLGGGLSAGGSYFAMLGDAAPVPRIQRFARSLAVPQPPPLPNPGRPPGVPGRFQTGFTSAILPPCAN